jgi:ring-1,2-phenylacetyl-CoA epoxidase subunit PaaC
MESKNDTIAAVAKKSIKEVDYHVDFSSTWLKRLGDGTQQSHDKMQEAVNELWRFSMELFKETESEKWAKEIGIGADLEIMKEEYLQTIEAVFEEATLKIPFGEVMQFGAKDGRHSEYLGYILADFQYMQRAYPDMKW